MAEKPRYQLACEAECKWCCESLPRDEEHMHLVDSERHYWERCFGLPIEEFAEQKAKALEEAEQRAAENWKRGAEAMCEMLCRRVCSFCERGIATIVTPQGYWHEIRPTSYQLCHASEYRALPIPEEPEIKPLTREERIARSLAVLREEPRIKLTPEEWIALMEEEPTDA